MKAESDAAEAEKVKEEADDIQTLCPAGVVKSHLNVVHSVRVPNIVAENVKRNIGLNIKGRVRRR